MSRKRKRKMRALNLPGVRLDVVGAVVGLARSAARKHGYGFDDDSVLCLALEAAADLNLSLTDSETESVANRLLGLQRIDERAYT
jgi:hypothetical protein